MTLTLGSRPQHLDDVDLVRYMDRQLDRAGTRRAELHLAVCAECAARLEGMRERGNLVSAFLAELDAPVSDEQRALAMATLQRARFRARPAAWVSRPGLAAAAMVALLLTAAFGTPPGRAWVSAAVERLGMARPGVATPESPVAGPTQAATPPTARAEAAAAEPGPAVPRATPVPRGRRAVLPPGMSEAVPFSPPGNYVLIRIDSRQRSGVLTLWIKNTSSATAQVVAGRRAETLVPTGDGLQLRNSATSRADYTVEVPTRYRYIRVQIGDEPETVIAINRARRDWLWNLSLADGGQ